jgi:excisionase family DNA binding protein
VQLAIRGSNGESDDLVLPGHVLQIVLDVLSEMSKGNAISLIPHHQELSTQEAANLLNVSRPFLVGLLEKGGIPFRKVGAHRRGAMRRREFEHSKQMRDEEERAVS